MLKMMEQILETQRELMRSLTKRGNARFLEETRVVPDAVTLLLSLPSSFRQTMQALYRLGGEATADDLANETGRLRNVESTCANHLARMGYVKKKRVGKKVHFFIDNNISER